MYKRGKMKNIFIILGIGIVLLMISGVFAEDSELSEKTKDFIEKIKEKRGINDEDITNVTKVSSHNLPPAIDIENIGDTNLAIYKVEYKGGKPIFVLTSSDKNLEKYSGPVYYSRLLLNFGFNSEMNGPGFLKTTTGVEGSLEKGYIMMRKGSITGISTNLEIINGEGQIEIIIYKNGEAIGFGNTLNADSSGIEKDYDLQSEDTVTFEPGDIISVYVKTQEKIVWKDVITTIEITTTNQ